MYYSLAITQSGRVAYHYAALNCYALSCLNRLAFSNLTLPGLERLDFQHELMQNKS